MGITIENIKIIIFSPFPLKVKPYVEPDKVKLSGPGISEKGVPASIPTTIDIDTTEAGYGDLEVRIIVSKNFSYLIKSS